MLNTGSILPHMQLLLLVQVVEARMLQPAEYVLEASPPPLAKISKAGVKPKGSERVPLQLLDTNLQA